MGEPVEEGSSIERLARDGDGGGGGAGGDGGVIGAEGAAGVEGAGADGAAGEAGGEGAAGGAGFGGREGGETGALGMRTVPSVVLTGVGLCSSNMSPGGFVGLFEDTVAFCEELKGWMKKGGESTTRPGSSCILSTKGLGEVTFGKVIETK